MTTGTGKVKKTRKTKEAAETTATAVSCSCDCGDQIKVLESKVEVLAQYMKTFNQFLNQSMISNTIDRTAEEGLTEVMDTYPAT